MSTPSPAALPPSADDLAARLRTAGCVFAEEEARLLLAAAPAAAALEELVARRVSGEPLEHILGWAAFCGLRIAVEPPVFVPRRRTELLVREAAALARAGTLVTDLCCGSGAIGAALLAAVPGVELHAADIDPAAVRCTRRNLTAAGGRVHEGDLFSALPAGLRGRIDVLVVNPPYVPTEAIAMMPPEARLHEAPCALDGGTDGLAVLRRVISEAPGWLSPSGHLLAELGERQIPEATAAVTRARLTPRVERCDDVGGIVLVASMHTAVIGKHPCPRNNPGTGDSPRPGLIGNL